MNITPSDKRFIYQKGITTIDEIIGNLLFRLNTNFLDTYIDITHFCSNDTIMATRVLEKILKYDVATQSTGTGCQDFEIILRPNGEDIKTIDQWTQFVTKQDRIMAENAEQNKPQPTINNYGNMVNGDSNSNVNQRLEPREVPFQSMENIYPNNAVNTGKKEQFSILKKIRDFTNHQVIGGLIVFITGTILITNHSKIWTWIKALF